jgi:hypothetical protein
MLAWVKTLPICRKQHDDRTFLAIFLQPDALQANLYIRSEVGHQAV